MKLTTTHTAGKLTVSVAGELDHHEAGELAKKIEEQLEANLPRDCVLDLGELKFMDSSGIAVILRIYRRMNALGGRLYVENVPSQPMRVLDASGIDRIVNIAAKA